MTEHAEGQAMPGPHQYSRPLQDVGDIDASRIARHHLDMLARSGITAEHAVARGYETVTDAKRLAEVGIVKAARGHLPGLLVPMLDVRGSTWGWQYRPDEPRLHEGKPVKYETSWQQRNGLDIPPGVADKLGDPNEPLWITEGCKEADCGALQGLCIVALSGVWNWLCTNTAGGKVALPDWRDVALNNRRVILAFDGDVARKPAVQKALHALANYLAIKHAKVEYLHLPDTDNKTGLDDHLMDGHTVEDLWKLVKPNHPGTADISDEASGPELEPAPVQPVALSRLHEGCRYWFGDHYDLDAIDATLAAAAVERLDGDPLWLLIVSGPGWTKTETVCTLKDCVGAIIVSTLTSTGALLSATANKDRSKGATGGLLKKIGEQGIMVLKDVTSILSLNPGMRAEILAALREVYDGYWSRNVGTDGGKTLEWKGRIVVVGAVTTAWDSHHAVVAAMGDRFVLLRTDSTKHRLAGGLRAIENTSRETEMRNELATLAAGVLAGINTDAVELTDDEKRRILHAADLVSLARTACEYDYKGNVIDAHAPEAPTRLAKQLTQLFRGAVAIGKSRADALRLVIRCARDSLPPLRLAIIDDLAARPYSTTNEVRKRLDTPRNTVDRQLQALHALRVVTVDEEPRNEFGSSYWHYTLSSEIEPDCLLVPEKSLTAHMHIEKGIDTPHTPLHTHLHALLIFPERARRGFGRT